MASDGEKRWLVVGLALAKDMAPVLRDTIKQGMDLHYTNTDAYCNHLALPCTLSTLTFSRVSKDATLKSLKFENINNNSQMHGKIKKNYNYNVSSAVDLAKLYLPDYLATFSAFDESLDMSAILRVLGWSRPAIFLSPDPLLSIQTAAGAVRDNIRNKWAHANFSEWTEAFFNDCFSKLDVLVKSVGLLGVKEKSTLDQLSYWQTKGCQIVMGHAIDQQLLDLVQQSFELFRKEFEAVQETIASLQDDITSLQDEQQSLESKAEEHQQETISLQETIASLQDGQQSLENKTEEQQQETISIQETIASLQDDIASLKDSQQSLESKAKEHQQRLDEMPAQQAEQARQEDENYNRVLEMFKSLRVHVHHKPEPPPERPFDLETFLDKLAARYKRTATVPTSVWSAKSKVDIRQVYTRLSMVKKDKSVPANYTDLFTETERGVLSKRVLVEGQAGIGKSTFVQKLSLDWVERDETNVVQERNVLKKFEVVLFIKLREVSHCQTLREVISSSDIFPEEDKHLTDDLLRYITENQEKVLLVFDGYDEYGKGSDSEVYQVFKGDKLRDCCVLMTSRSSQADDVREFADVQAEITGFNTEDIKQYLAKQLGEADAEDLFKHLEKQRLIDTAKVPLLALFFSILWKKGKASFIDKTRTVVFSEIVQCILDYGHGKCTPSKYSTIEESKDILIELGRVALEALLNDDLLFEYGKLAAIKCEVSVIHGFLQITEYTENVRPAERVSFLHKTIQEFLAAWYIAYKCIPEGDLGTLQEQANDLEKCLRFENVFQFICGLSNDGAVLVLDLFKAIKLCDATLDLSKTIVLPETRKQTCYDVTDRQRRFHDLVFASFGQAQSKEGLLGRCILCTSGVVLLSEQLLQHLLEVTNVTREIHSGVIIFRKFQHDFQFSLGKNLRMFFDRLHVAVKITDSSEVLQLGDFFRKFLNCGFLCMCDFSAILLVNEDSLSFYITDLVVACEPHGYMFIGGYVGPNPLYYVVAERINDDQKYRQQLRLEHLVPFSFPFERQSDTRSTVNKLNSPEEACLAHLQYIEFVYTSRREIIHELGVIAGKSKYLKSVHLQIDRGDVCEFLEQVKETNSCSLRLSIQRSHACMPAGAVKLAVLLPKFNNISILSLNLKRCNDVVVSNLVAAITHTTLKILCLKEVDLTGSAAIVLGHSICQMSALEILTINGKNNYLGLPQMQALFERFVKALPLRELELSCFRVAKEGLFLLRRSFKFFPKLQVLQLVHLGMDAGDVCNLIDGVNFPELHQLYFSENQLGHGITSIKEHIVSFPNLIQLVLYNVGCSEEDVNCINEAVKKVRPMFNVCTMTGLTTVW